MDEESRALILELLHQDASEVLSAQKGKQPAGQVTDVELAFQTQREELERVQTIISDRRMCESIGRAVLDDGPAVVAAQTEERAVQEDRCLAYRLAGQAHPTHSNNPPWDDLTEETVGFLRRFNVQDENEESFPSTLIEATVEGGDLSNTTNTEVTSETEKQFQCVACLEDAPESQCFQAPCDHPYCHRCVTQLYEEAVVDESLFPPRCCRQEFDLCTVGNFLGSELLQRVEQKAIEYSTDDRTYCSNPVCSKFLLPDGSELGNVVCPDCSQRTCLICKLVAHEGTCEGSLEDSLLQFAAAEGWMRCYRCKALVELRSGCNHITCRCRAEFCYVCGQPWKNCPCVQWQEDRLYERATELVDRRPPRAEGSANAWLRRDREIQYMIQQVRARHECRHEGEWKFIRGRSQCEQCQDWLPTFILECRYCNLRLCRRCKHNRA